MPIRTRINTGSLGTLAQRQRAADRAGVRRSARNRARRVSAGGSGG